MFYCNSISESIDAMICSIARSVSTVGLSEWIQIAMAFFTLLAVITSLFGDYLKSKWFKPRIIVMLKSPLGEKSAFSYPSPKPGESYSLMPCTFFHITVGKRNPGYSIANDAQVKLLSVVSKSGDHPHEVWIGDVPLRWRYHDMHPSMFRAIGPNSDCDLCSVTDYAGVPSLFIHPTFYPITLVHGWQGKTLLVLTLKVVFREGSTEEILVTINWDGSIPGDNAAQHITIKIEQ